MSAGKWCGNTSASSSTHAKERLLHGLPMRPYALVGREKDLEMSQALILRGNVRLVTITGPPGVGKTRFAIELASTVASEFDDGVVFVDLAPVRDAGLVLDAIARALGVADHPDRPALQRLQRYLGDRNLLLLLDNLEHVISAAAGVADLLAAGPHVKVLVTSRQPLHVRWEHRYGLLPLANALITRGCCCWAAVVDGSEAFYVLAGQQTVRTPEGVILIAAGQAEAGPAGGTPLQVSSSGGTDLHAVVMFVMDATKPFSSPATFP